MEVVTMSTKRKINRTWIRKAHRWLGLAFSLTILMSAGSGVLHTLMTRSQSPPPAPRAAGSSLNAGAIHLSASEALDRLPEGTSANAVNIRMISGEPWYQIFTPPSPQPTYVSAVDGRVDPKQDELYAAEIAAGFLGGKEVTATNYLTGFDNEYIAIFRLLPVHRFDAKDEAGTRVYVSTTTGSVARYTDNAKQFEASVFTNFHKLGFIPNKEVRDWVQVILMGGIVIVSLLGIVLFFLTRPTKKAKHSDLSRQEDP
jgi:hypothetical protein